MTNASEDLDGECIHLLTRRFCADCNGVADMQRKEHDLEVERVLAMPGWFPAKYPGRCAKDNTYYHPGTPIRRKNGLDRCNVGSSSWVAMCCAPAEEDEGAEDEEW
jgi:hypothetical protein